MSPTSLPTHPKCIVHSVLLLLAVCLLPATALAARGATGAIAVTVVDDKTGEPLPGASVYLPLLGRGGAADQEGRFRFSGLGSGFYAVEISMIGYIRWRQENVRVRPDTATQLRVRLTATILPLGEEIVVLGERALLDVNEPATRRAVTGAELAQGAGITPMEAVMQQPGVTQVDREVHIRGGRTYETDYTVDGISVTDPFLRQGMAVQLSPRAIERLQVQTGGIGPDNGAASSGLVAIDTRNPETHLTATVTYTTDRLAPSAAGDWNSDGAELSLSGPLNALGLPSVSHDPRLEPGFVLNLGSALTDTHMGSGHPSSSVWGGSRWTPRSEDRYHALIKLSWRVTPHHRLVFLHSGETNIGQDRSVLDTWIRTATYSYGWPYAYARNLQDYDTFTRQANTQQFHWEYRPGENAALTVSAARVFSRLHADANGKSPDLYLPPQDTGPAIVEVTPDSTFFTIQKGDGFYDVGDGDLWYDHYAETQTLKADLRWTPRPNWNLSVGSEGSSGTVQVIDIFRPWIGLGGLNTDYYRAHPASGAGWLQSRFNFQGAVLDVGLRGELWWPGTYLEDAVNDTTLPNITPTMREEFLAHTSTVFGHQAQGWVLPRVGLSFALGPSASLYVSYDRLAQRPNPRYLYAKLKSRSPATFQLFGNPALVPERTTAIEGGIKWLRGPDWALTVSVYQREVKDYIAATVVVPDPDAPETFWYAYANRQSALSRGVELTLEGRVRPTFHATGMLNLARVTGEHSLPSDIWRGRQTRESEVLFEEVRLDWDKPWRVALTAGLTFGGDNRPRILGLGLWRNWDLNVSFWAEAGKRFTPYGDSVTATADTVYFRTGAPNSELGPCWSSLDVTWEKHFKLGHTTLSLVIAATNLLNHRNITLINPVTGDAYRRGEPIPTGDNFFETAPTGYNLPIWDDPAGYDDPLHWLFGVKWSW
ncbi:MAG: TonB-dependent receptor [Candidatus Zixiibacteriota bacterium]